MDNEINFDDLESLRNSDHPTWRAACVLKGSERDTKYVTWAYDGYHMGGSDYLENGNNVAGPSFPTVYNAKPDIVRYVNVYPNNSGSCHMDTVLANHNATMYRIATIKLTYSQDTGEVHSEVVE